MWHRRVWSRARRLLGHARGGLVEPGTDPPGSHLLEEPGAVLERAIAAFRAREWAAAETDFRSVIDATATSSSDRQVARNIYGRLLERTRRIEEAIELYEANLREGFPGTFPFERLAEIYRKRGAAHEERRVLERAVSLAHDELRAGKQDAAPRLERLEARLRAAEENQ